MDQIVERAVCQDSPSEEFTNAGWLDSSPNKPASPPPQESDSDSTEKPDGRPKLRPYQAEVIGRCQAEVAAGKRRVVLVAPTGSGKTVIAAALIRAAVDRGERVLFLAHRREL